MGFWLLRQWRNLFGGGRGALLNVRDVTAQMQWHTLRGEELQHALLAGVQACEARAAVWRECLAAATQQQNRAVMTTATEQLVLLEHASGLLAKSMTEGRDDVEFVGAELQQAIYAFRRMRAQFDQTGVDVRDIVLPDADAERIKVRATISTEWEQSLLPETAARELLRALG